MTYDEMLAMLKRITDGMPERTEPACVVFQTELGLEDHDDAHALIRSLAVAAYGEGARTPETYSLIAFALGRRWGLIEAADMLAEADHAE